METSSDLQPEILSPYHVTNWMPFVVREDPDGFSIVCRETPMRAIWSNTIIIGTTFIGFGVLILLYAANKNWIWFAILLGLATTLGFHFGTIAYHRYEQKKGPVFAYEGGSKMAKLPRENLVLKLEEIGFAALVTGTGGSDENHTQLQIHARDGRRFLIITAYTVRELLPMAKAIADRTSIPVRAFFEKSHGRKMWEERTISALP